MKFSSRHLANITVAVLAALAMLALRSSAFLPGTSSRSNMGSANTDADISAMHPSASPPRKSSSRLFTATPVPAPIPIPPVVPEAIPTPDPVPNVPGPARDLPVTPDLPSPVPMPDTGAPGRGPMGDPVTM